MCKLNIVIIKLRPWHKVFGFRISVVWSLSGDGDDLCLISYGVYWQPCLIVLILPGIFLHIIVPLLVRLPHAKLLAEVLLEFLLKGTWGIASLSSVSCQGSILAVWLQLGCFKVTPVLLAMLFHRHWGHSSLPGQSCPQRPLPLSMCCQRCVQRIHLLGGLFSSRSCTPHFRHAIILWSVGVAATPFASSHEKCFYLFSFPFALCSLACLGF